MTASGTASRKAAPSARRRITTGYSLAGLVFLLAPAPVHAHPAGLPPVAQIVPAGAVARTSLTFALDDTILLLLQAGAAETDPSRLGPDALATQPGVEAYIASRYGLSVPEGPCTTTMSGGRDVGYGIRFLLDHTCPAPIGRTLRVHGELLRDLSPDYRLSVIVTSGGTSRRAMIAPSRTEVTVDLTPAPAGAATGTPRPQRPSASAKGLERLFTFLDAGRGIGAAVAAFAIAGGLGALHGLGPGHGKTLVAAYLAGSEARIRHAFAVGVVLSVTHTGAVIVFGLVALAAGHAFVPQRIEPVLSAVAAGLVIGLGLWMLARRIVALRAPADEHAHAQHAARTGRGLLTIGLAGGIVPCPEAFGLLFVALTIGRVLAGLYLLVAFSIGLAAVLVAVATALVLSRTAIAPRLERSRAVRYLPVVSAALVTAIGIVLAARAAARF